MIKKKRFATVFKDFQQVHLTKDVGMIPMAMSKILTVKSKLIYWKRGAAVKNEYEDLIELVPVEASNYLFFNLKLIFVIFKHRINIVNFYHMEKSTIILTILMKMMNVKTYIKLDISKDTVDLIESWSNTGSVKMKALLIFLKAADIVSIEEYSLKSKLIEVNSLFRKIIYFPNSILTDTIPVTDVDKEKIMLIVGRIGTYQKNHELLFEAINKIKFLNNWSFVFAGPIDSCADFEIPDTILKNKQVKFVGNLNREQLFDLYARSKVFVLPSRWEGFSLALLEAAYMECYIVATRVGGVEAVTDNGRFGTIIEQNDIDNLVLELNKIINEDNDSVSKEQICRGEFVREHFNLESNLRKINWNDL